MGDEITDSQEHLIHSNSQGEEGKSSSDEEDDDEYGNYPVKLPKYSVLIKNIAEEIRSLSEVSLLVSRPGFSRRYLHSTGENEYDPRVAHYANYDLQYIGEKLRQWRQQPKKIDNDEPVISMKALRGRASAENIMFQDQEFLRRRLAKANTKRREQLHYWSRHPDTIPEAVNPVEQSVSVSSVPIPLGSKLEQAAPLSGTKVETESLGFKSTFTKKSFSTVAISDLFDTQTQAGPVRTIYAESTIGNRTSNQVPNMPKLEKSTPFFKCPYCQMMLGSKKMQNRIQWKYVP